MLFAELGILLKNRRLKRDVRPKTFTKNDVRHVWNSDIFRAALRQHSYFYFPFLIQ